MTEDQELEASEEEEGISGFREDEEFKEFRNLMTTPDDFEDGFGWGTVLMAFFVGLLMVPAQMYLQLVAGMSLGSAAEWVTVILYVEVARRAFKKLKRPEIFVLFYMCGAVISSSSAGQGLLWQQFAVQSEQFRAMGITEYIPWWYAPSNPDILAQRSFLLGPWTVPLLMMVFGMFMGRLNNFGLGYVMFRLTSDIEKLPFPMAPVAAMGMTALADASDEKETWRWRTFCFGSVIGMIFGFVYLGIPTVTGALFAGSLSILPLPFLDLTSYTDSFLPAMPVLISFDLAFVISGMVLPFWAMMGSVIGLVFTVVANPVLYHMGILNNWEPGIGGIKTVQANVMDFYFSFGLGLSFAIAVIGFYYLFKALKGGKTGPKIRWRRLLEPPPNRGD
ncbi:MAG: peptide transporter, partial [Desulfobacterales bacterium]